MKVQLYALHIGSKWTWNLSVHTHTDIHYWFEQYGADASIRLLEPFVSLGQAIRMLQALSTDSILTSAMNRNSPLTPFKARLQYLARKCGLAQHVCDSLTFSEISYVFWQMGKVLPLQLQADRYERIVKACSGRQLLVDELHQLLALHGVDSTQKEDWLPYLQLAHLQGDLRISSGLHIYERRDWRRPFVKKTVVRCKRCGSGAARMYWTDCIHCGQACPYCEECLTMGRARYCSLLIQGRAVDVSLHSDADDLHAYIEPWGLSPAQTAASLEGLRYVSGGTDAGGKSSVEQEAKRFLIWAVTGAGKTEMIFPFIHYTVARGGKALIATPRKDVVLELRPRIKRAFSDYTVVTLYGGSEQRWEQGQITIATTHQLMRFHQAFDLVIIDEIDAFPYHNNPTLAYAAATVVKPGGSNVLLSATPPKEVRTAADRGRLPHVRVPVRYHRHPLPVPELLSVPTLRRCCQSNTLPDVLATRLQASIKRGAQVFVFVPNIKLVEPMVELLRSKLRAEDGSLPLRVEGTSSKDADRTEKVQHFRDKAIRLLVTTTILERGVTIPKSDVYILDADSSLFDEAALVQMAGRAGRSKDDPAGMIYFAANEVSLSQREAVRQIKQMNRIARKKGYLRGENE
ncbi:DEAD/DEAH box helicase [Paenibacillus aestuarii]|uniref:DEAD/DEAH box helicase n=1 Tax=Paenibacillus aestuarii TaxID=516965 RepID=A0ABW0K7F0_9BACL|nr:helicase-related protein [Paenibacillus aestuarii]